ncbi:MAG: choice-of-anchor D domain-containing protein [Gaiellaceae bacterium]
MTVSRLRHLLVAAFAATLIAGVVAAPGGSAPAVGPVVTTVVHSPWASLPLATDGSGVRGATSDSYLCGPASDYSCLAGTGYTGQSVWGSWGPGHNCVSYAAYRLQQNGASKPWGPQIGNGSDWDEKARAAGVPVDRNPVVGSIAQWDSGFGGHVAYVEVVASSYIEISEDSYVSDTSGYSSRRRLDRSGATFAAAEFIHVKDGPQGPPPGSPIGAVDAAGGSTGNFASLRGWVLDPDAKTTSTSIHVYIDGEAGSGARGVAIPADQPRPDVAAAHGASAEHGFSWAIPDVAPGPHTLHVYGINIAGGGENAKLATLSINVPGIAGGTPFGAFDIAGGRVGGAARIRGWTIDPDAVTTSTGVHVYIDGPAGSGVRGVDFGLANQYRPDVGAAYPGAGNYHGFDGVIAGLSPGNHTFFVYALNASGGGDNRLLRTLTASVPGPTPIGNVETAVGSIGNFASLRGWVLDPDAPAAATSVHVYIDGPAGSGARGVVINADQPRPDVAEAYGSGPDHGFSWAIPDVASGAHTLYIYGINIAGDGSNTLLKTETINVPAPAAGTPFGAFDTAVGQTGGKAHIRGWTIDPDAMTAPTGVHVYIDGPAGSGVRGVDLGLADRHRDDVAAAHPGAGPNHGFDTIVGGLSPGKHTLFAYALNAAAGGDNPLLRTLTVTVVKPAPLVSLSPTSLAFGNVPVNSTSAGKKITVKNSGSAALTISGFNRSGANQLDFSISAQTCTSASPIPVGGSCQVTVVTRPQAAGARSANLLIINNAPGSPHPVPLSATGT